MISRILVGTDTSSSADLAVEKAAELARAHDADLTVLYVRPAVASVDVLDPAKQPDPERYLRGVTGRFSDLRVRTRQEPGEAAAKICQVAEEEGVDVIVVGNRGIHERKRGFLRSVPRAVLQRSPCSVLIVDTRAAR